MIGELNEYVKAVKELLPKIEGLNSQVNNVAEKISSCLKNGGKVLVCGNGGSAADAQHIAGELVGRFLKERPAYHCIALTTDTSVLTAIGNDYGYDSVFSRQVEGLGKTGDVLIAISTSGNSMNVIKAVEMAKEKGIIVIGLLGRDGGKLKTMCDVSIVVQHEMTPVIQIMHSMIYHSFCHQVEERLTQ